MIKTIENRLVIKSCRLELHTSDIEEIKSIIKQKIDWQYVLQQSIYHGVVGQVYLNLAKIVPDKIPVDIYEQLRKSYLTICAIGLQKVGLLPDIANMFQSEGVEFIVLKGAELAEDLYGNLGLRPFSDIDFLIREHDWPVVYKQLRHNGYTPAAGKDFDRVPPKLTRYDVRSHMQWISPNETLIEFQFDLLTLGIGMRDPDSVWSRSRKSTLYDLRVRKLSPEDQILQMVIHANRHGCNRLKWMVDIAETLLNKKDIDWGLVKKICETEKVGACFYQTISHIEKTFEQNFLGDEVRTELKPDIFKKAIWNRTWPLKDLDDFNGRVEDGICFYFYKPLSGWNLVNFLLMGRAWEKIEYQFRWLFPSISWMSETYDKPKSLALLKYYAYRFMNIKSSANDYGAD